MADEDHLPLARNGDHRAFMALIQPVDEPLRQMVYGIVRDRSAMQDVMQDAYLKAFRAIDRFDGKSSFKTWMYRIAYNAAIDHTRRNSKITPISDEVIDSRVAPTPSGEVGSSSRLDVEAALRTLSSAHRAAVLMVDAQGMSVADAATALGVPPGTMASRLFHARKQLRAALGAYLEDQ